MTLADVARACDPPTTPQTIGRLETGTRTVSVGWLNRIAAALGVDARDLVPGGGEAAEIKLVAMLGPGGAMSARSEAVIIPPRPMDRQIALLVSGSVGDYRAGDEIWCDTLEPDSYGRALNRDVLVPRHAGRFLFGRMINRDDEKLHILPLDAGGRQQVVASPTWIGLAVKLVRTL